MISDRQAGFADIYAAAVRQTGSKTALERRLPRVRGVRELETRPDSYYLSTMARRIFRAGLKHAMVDAKWPAFEEVVHVFDPSAVVEMSDEDLEHRM
jgi:3-methyladenine DNA glycosylase Tag